MPPRHTYWTIIFANQPTAFRSATAEELLPTFKQIQAKHPDAVMMWFARGKLWKSPEEEREHRERARRPKWGRPPHRDERPRGPRPEWKPPPAGGSPRDEGRGARGEARGSRPEARVARGEERGAADRPALEARAARPGARSPEPEASVPRPEARGPKPEAGLSQPEASVPRSAARGSRSRLASRRRTQGSARSLQGPARREAQAHGSEVRVEEEEGRGQVIAHIVLLQPRPELSDEQRRLALAALAHAAENVPEIRRFKIGRRIKHGLPGYEQMMPQDFEFALVIEFDDVEALKRYLAAPAHGALGNLFSTATSAALAYDYEMVDPGDADSLLRS